MKIQKFIFSLALLLACDLSQAAYTVNISQNGPDVLATGSGSLNLSALTMNGAGPASPSMTAFNGSLLLGPEAGIYESFTGAIAGPASFGPGARVSASRGTGAMVGISQGFSLVVVPASYVSGTPLGTSSASWDASTLAGLGLTPGSYTWRWGVGPAADSFTVVVHAAPESPAVPTLSGWSLLGAATLLLSLGVAGVRRRRNP